MALKEMYPGMINSPETTITNNINESDTIIYVLDPARVPEPPNLMTLGTGTNAETVRVIEINGSAITVERGFQGVPKAWPAGTVIARNFTEYDYRALKENIEDLEANKETPAGAQAKADAALAAAKQYTDQEVGEVSQALDAHKAETIHQGKHSTLEATSTDNATSVTDAPLKSAGGLAVAKDAYLGGFSVTDQSVSGYTITKLNRALGGGNNITLCVGDYIVTEPNQKAVIEIDVGRFTIPFYCHLKVVGGGIGTIQAGRNLITNRIFAGRLESDEIVEKDIFSLGFSTNSVYMEKIDGQNKVKITIENSINYTAYFIVEIDWMGIGYDKKITDIRVENI